MSTASQRNMPPSAAPGPVALRRAGWIFLLLALALALLALPRTLDKLGARAWPTARAEILASNVVERSGKSRAWCIRLAYRYPAGGASRVSNGISTEGGESWACSASRAAAEARLAALGPGRHIAVRYDPDAPERAIVHLAGPDMMDVFFAGLVLTLAAAGADHFRRARLAAGA